VGFSPPQGVIATDGWSHALVDWLLGKVVGFLLAQAKL
jgi:hypothetical protein